MGEGKRRGEEREGGKGRGREGDKGDEKIEEERSMGNGLEFTNPRFWENSSVAKM